MCSSKRREVFPRSEYDMRRTDGGKPSFGRGASAGFGLLSMTSLVEEPPDIILDESLDKEGR
eukprot:4998503-Prymnesium_polylepis.1